MFKPEQLVDIDRLQEELVREDSIVEEYFELIRTQLQNYLIHNEIINPPLKLSSLSLKVYSYCFEELVNTEFRTDIFNKFYNDGLLEVTKTLNNSAGFNVNILWQIYSRPKFGYHLLDLFILPIAKEGFTQGVKDALRVIEMGSRGTGEEDILKLKKEL